MLEEKNRKITKTLIILQVVSSFVFIIIALGLAAVGYLFMDGPDASVEGVTSIVVPMVTTVVVVLSVLLYSSIFYYKNKKYKIAKNLSLVVNIPVAGYFVYLIIQDMFSLLRIMWIFLTGTFL